MKIYRHGIHTGEESIVFGNDRSGMVVFSGCHLNCSFCYTPETSVHKLGKDYNDNTLSQLLLQLIQEGALNLNFITPTHVWGQLKHHLPSIIPVVLKTSGMQSESIITDMREKSQVIVTDFKFLSPKISKKYNLPEQYGEITTAAHALLGTSPQIFKNGKLIQGTLVRHLIMPGEETETRLILDQLLDMKYKGVVNLMTHYISPKGSLHTVPQNTLASIIETYSNCFEHFLINGKSLNKEYTYAC